MSALPAEERRTVLQGEHFVTRDPAVVLTTVLGSCVAACFHDEVAGVGGLNHFLLPAPIGLAITDPAQRERYGVHAMELLVNDLLKRGADRRRLRARLFGGANMHRHLRPIGDENVAFARQYLAGEAIPLAGEEVGGGRARRIDFRAAMGLVRCRVVDASPVETPHALPRTGDVELF